MDIVKTFTYNKHFSISIAIRGSPINPLFRAEDICEALGNHQANIKCLLEDYKDSEKVLLKCSTDGKDTLFLTQKGVYKLILSTSNFYARRYVLNDWISDVVEEIKVFVPVETKQIPNPQITNVTRKKWTLADFTKEREDMLLSEFATGSVIYIVLNKGSDPHFAIRIGSSRKGVSRQLIKEYGWIFHPYNVSSVRLVHCFQVGRSKEFESFIHFHPEVEPYRECFQQYQVCFQQTMLQQGREKERDLFIINRGIKYERLLEIIEDNLCYYLDSNNAQVEQQEFIYTGPGNNKGRAIIYTPEDDSSTELQLWQHEIQRRMKQQQDCFDQQLHSLQQKFDELNCTVLQSHVNVSKLVADVNTSRTEVESQPSRLLKRKGKKNIIKRI